jgi:pyruvate/2-oxoglutarate dehydrogenase complex dihydrolipoamide acyltransferase (E2) component
MSEPTPIVVPRENVNDESATLVAWTVAEGSRVAPGQPIAQIETSKAVVDLPAPAGGILRPRARAGEDLPIGAVLGWIVAEGATPTPEIPSAPAGSSNGHEARPSSAHSGALPLSPAGRRIVAEEKIDPSQVRGTGRGGRITKADLLTHLADTPSPAGPDPSRSPRFSQGARELIRRLGLDEHAFAGRGLVRSRDVLAAARPPEQADPAEARPVPTVSAPQPGPIAAVGVATRAERLPRAKRTEAKYLRAGAGATLPSAVTVACPTRGFRNAVARQAAVGGNATAVIVFETARLLRKYPAFNAYHDDGAIHYYEHVNVGFAIDDGRGLKVPVIRDADRKGLAAIADEMREIVIAYLDDALTVAALAGGTFTVTDLSGEGVAAFHPLINQGQSAILGVCAEVFPPGAVAGMFNLVLAFDHQLSEGRTAARFLNELRERLAHYESTLVRGDGPRAEEPRCSRCQAGYHELTANGHALIPTVQADGSTRLLCKLCLAGWT